MDTGASIPGHGAVDSMKRPAVPDAVLYDPARHSHLLPSFAALHVACVEEDFTVATFLPPFASDVEGTDGRVLEFWKGYSSQVAAGSMIIAMQMMPSEQDGKEELAGYVCLDMPPSETGPFRGYVLKMLVHPKFRQRGVARRVMSLLETAAKEAGRTMLVLDTTLGTPAELVYPRLGWNRVGVIPRNGFSPKDGSLVDEVYFYKDLREADTPGTN